MSVGWPALCGPPVEGSTMSLSSQALRRFGPAFQQGVRGPFWDFSLLFLHPSDTLPVILSWDCFTFPRDVPGTPTDPVEGKPPVR